MNRIIRIIGTILLILLGGYLIWRFSFLIVYILIAAVVSIIGHPVVRLFDHIRIGRIRMPHGISTLITLLLLLSCFLGLFAIFLPLIIQEAQAIVSLDLNNITTQLKGPLGWVQDQLLWLGLLPKGHTLQQLIAEKAKSMVSISNISAILNGLLGFAGSFFIDLFSIVFIAFFFLKDDHMFEGIVLIVTPEKHADATRKVLHSSKALLMRYFIGVCFEVLGGITLITMSFILLGVQNALLLGFFAGFLNIIPYVGPIFGSITALTLALTQSLANGDLSTLNSLILKIIIVLFGVHYLDTMLFQPIIYSNSVKAHPLEIFFAIIIGGSLGGIIGMLIAVPCYTVLRVIGKEFFSKFRLIQKLTKDL
ncbi:MAG: AI-2E family transporter [Bacteroidetes bacterium]|nr:AI-2E family transporter [Bacteroidota bacterium]